MGVESTGTKSYPIVMNKLLPRRYKSVIYKESKIMVANSEIAQYTTDDRSSHREAPVDS